MTTQQQFEQSMLNYYAHVDPMMDTKLGTVSRKHITMTASQLANLATDITLTNTLYSIDSYSGEELEKLVGLFGFARQEAKTAAGTITLTRDNADSDQDIAYGSQFYKPANSSQGDIYFQTTQFQRFEKGVTRVDIPVIATIAGKEGNVEARAITHTTTHTGYFSVINSAPTTGGRDIETDEELRTRFVNTIFRGEFGTRDQYLGLALAHAANSRASVIGQESTWTETVAVQDDYTATYNTEEVTEMLDVETRFWIRNADTDEIYTRSEYQVDVDTSTVTFQNILTSELIGPLAKGNIYELSKSNVLQVNSITTSDGITQIDSSAYSVDGNAITIGSSYPTDLLGQTALVTYVYKAAHIDDFITIEYDYLSNLNRGGQRTVEMFVDGQASQSVTDLLFLNFNNRVTASNKSQWIRKDGTMPNENSLFIPLTYQPVDRSTNGQINVGASIILREDEQFHVIYDSGHNNRDGSTRGADAIEFVGTFSGEQNTFTPAGTNIALTNETPLNVPYLYNKVPSDVQALVDQQSVVTANTLVHAVRRRYFGIHITLMFDIYTREAIQQTCETAIIDWANNIPFGHTIQFSDIETVVANIAGVDNVRISDHRKDDDGGKKAYGVGDFLAHGIVEYERDNETQKAQFVDDFEMKSNECFEVSYVHFVSRTQQGW